MEFRELKNKVVQNAINYGKKYNVQIDEDFALLKLYEEVGELAQAVLVHKKRAARKNMFRKKRQKKNWPRNWQMLLV